MEKMNFMNEASGAPVSDAAVESIRAWLTAEIVELLSVDPETLDQYEPLGNYGLSSMTGMMLAGDLEEYLGLKMDPSLIWEYPTIDALTHYLSQEMSLEEAR